MNKILQNAPLEGVRVVQMPAIGPIPFCSMTLADLGAQVTRIDRPSKSNLGLPIAPEHDFQSRGKRSIALDLKHPQGLEAAQRLIDASDIVLEGFRPGVMERLGLGPDTCFARRPALVYGRINGWGSHGALAQVAGHDINYLAQSGALATIGTREQPVPPLNLVGDYGAALFLVGGVLAALTKARADGIGGVVETSIVRAAAALMTMPQSLRAAGQWSAERADNALDGGAPFYRTYETADGGFMAVGAIEAVFYANFVDTLGLSGRLDLARQHDKAAWPVSAALIAARFREQPRAYWAALFRGADNCCTPVLSMDEAGRDADNLTNAVYVETSAGTMPGPGIVTGDVARGAASAGSAAAAASRTSAAAEATPELARHLAQRASSGDATLDILATLGYSPTRIAAMLADGAVFK